MLLLCLDTVVETSMGDVNSFSSFNIQKLHILPTEYISTFCMDLTTPSNYFPPQHQLTGSYNSDTVSTARYELDL